MAGSVSNWVGSDAFFVDSSSNTFLDYITCKIDPYDGRFEPLMTNYEEIGQW